MGLEEYYSVAESVVVALVLAVRGEGPEIWEFIFR